jgi:hypothetical protein
MTTNNYLGAGFAALGLLVGSIAGLSSAQLTTTLLGLLFALIGGSIIAFIEKLDNDSRRAAGLSLLAFAPTAMLGLYLGIFVRVNDFLRMQPAEATVSRASADDYLRGSRAEQVAFLQAQIVRGEMKLEDACGALDHSQE